MPGAGRRLLGRLDTSRHEKSDRLRAPDSDPLSLPSRQIECSFFTWFRPFESSKISGKKTLGVFGTAFAESRLQTLFFPLKNLSDFRRKIRIFRLFLEKFGGGFLGFRLHRFLHTLTLVAHFCHACRRHPVLPEHVKAAAQLVVGIRTRLEHFRQRFPREVTHLHRHKSQSVVFAFDEPAKGVSVRRHPPVDRVSLSLVKAEGVTVQQPFLRRAEADKTVDAGDPEHPKQLVRDSGDPKQRSGDQEADLTGGSVLGPHFIHEGGQMDARNKLVECKVVGGRPGQNGSGKPTAAGSKSARF